MNKSPRAVATGHDYAGLLNGVRKVFVEGRARVEQERVRTYWETGRLIHRYILKHKGRADYGAEIVKSLAKDLDVNLSLLQRCVQFARSYPRLPIVARGRQFTWSQYRELITVNDDGKRASLEKAAVRHAWSAREIAARKRKPALADGGDGLRELPSAGRSPVVKLLAPLRGELYSYRLVERPGLSAGAASGLLVDLGFGIYHQPAARLISGFSKNDIIESRPKEDIYRFYRSGRAAKDLFTFAAYVEKVIDGDTVKARLDLGFGVWTRQVLRLRDIDCPEAGTPEGDEARDFVRSHLKEAQMIIVRSSRSDKYDRYLADIFIPAEGGKDIFLNNLLLEQRHAIRM